MGVAISKPIGRVGRDVWDHVPAGLQQRRPLRSIASWIHALSRRFSNRAQSQSTWFLRNQPLLATVRDAVSEFGPGETLRVCILGCSTGAEAYSILFTLRKARPDLKILPVAIDIAESAIERAKAGRYKRNEPELRGEVSDGQLLELFDASTEDFKVKPWVAEGIDWRVGNANDDGLRSSLKGQHIVFANNFLVHMKPKQATACLRNVIRLVKPGGLLVCRGVDLNVRRRVVDELRLEPVAARIEEIHNSEPALDAPHGWPWSYWGLEPLDKARPDWIKRYAAVYRAPAAPEPR